MNTFDATRATAEAMPDPHPDLPATSRVRVGRAMNELFHLRNLIECIELAADGLGGAVGSDAISEVACVAKAKLDQVDGMLSVYMANVKGGEA